MAFCVHLQKGPFSQEGGRIFPGREPDLDAHRPLDRFRASVGEIEFVEIQESLVFGRMHDERDLGSKRIFSFLMFVFTLVETGEKGIAPVVTLPTG